MSVDNGLSTASATEENSALINIIRRRKEHRCYQGEEGVLPAVVVPSQAGGDPWHLRLRSKQEVKRLTVKYHEEKALQVKKTKVFVSHGRKEIVNLGINACIGIPQFASIC